MSKSSMYQIRFSSYPRFQSVLDRTIKKAVKATGGPVTRKIIVLSGLLALKHSTRQEIISYRKRLEIDKNPNKPENEGAIHRAVEISLHDTAIAKSLQGHIAYELRLHDVSMRELYHLGLYPLSKLDQDDLATLIIAATAINRDLNS